MGGVDVAAELTVVLQGAARGQRPCGYTFSGNVRIVNRMTIKR